MTVNLENVENTKENGKNSNAVLSTGIQYFKHHICFQNFESCVCVCICMCGMHAY